MIATAQDLAVWFDGHKGQVLTIDKEEGTDKDRVRLKLERVERIDRESVADAYTPRRALRLVGSGTIHNPEDDPVELPDDGYEIVLDGLVSHTESAGGLTIKTMRATYRIQA
ncbi:hypothetical protein ACFFK0_08505 [Paenibacillus chartarius]|uniref:Uncharacterized protein n=1 Tax=Paenibacillus chartarius TaxID=747481 RepID=A0ABV6DIM8_9BACL